MAFSAEKVINGSWGAVWVGDDPMAEATGVEAKVTINKEEVKQIGTLSKGYKVVGIEGKGTLKLHKVSSYFIELMSENIKNGKSTVCDIITKLADPQSDGTERIKLVDCTFDELTLADWESQKLLEESLPFTFSSWEILDTIPSV